MRMAKVIVGRTPYNASGLCMQFVTTVDAEAKPEAVFKFYGFGKVENYTVTPAMPLDIALEHCSMIRKKLGIDK